jgi:hypothetical protein
MIIDITERLKAYSKIVHRVTQYGELLEGWDGRASTPPSAATIGVALQFLRLIPIWLPMPTAACSGTGMLNFYWDRPTTYVDVEIDRTQQISTLVICRRDSKKDKWLADEPISCITSDWFTTHLSGLKEENQTTPIRPIPVANTANDEQYGVEQTNDQFDGVDAEPVS